MRLAWFCPSPSDDHDPTDDTASLLAELARYHQIERYDARRAPDFVWQQWRTPFDLCVYELGDTPAYSFVWPYLLHYPGIVRLRGMDLHRSRAHDLRRASRRSDFAAERAFTHGHTLRIPLLASRLAVVGDAHLAAELQDDHRDARVRFAPIGVAGATLAAPAGDGVVRVATVATTRTTSIRRAAQRARDTGSQVELLTDAPGAAAIASADVIITLPWPPAPEPPAAALAAMAARRPVIVHETPATAAWPALDPQTWQPRGFLPGLDPIAISIDLRDEEHSLMLALRRLSADADLRTRVGRSAHGWWREHATAVHAATAWEPLLEEAVAAGPPPVPQGWPAHLTADGTERAREILAELGVDGDHEAFAALR